MNKQKGQKAVVFTIRTNVKPPHQIRPEVLFRAQFCSCCWREAMTDSDSVQNPAGNSGCRAEVSGGPLASRDALIYFSSDCAFTSTQSFPLPLFPRKPLESPQRAEPAALCCRFLGQVGSWTRATSSYLYTLQTGVYSVWPVWDSRFSRSKMKLQWKEITQDIVVTKI